MTESKKYFWLRLKRDFFKRHDIRIIEAMPNGKDYILFYLKLLCESVDHEGNLRFSDQIPYNEEMLSTLTNTNVDIVRSAIKIFTELGMMEILDDGTYFMNEVQKMIGCETEWAEKKRKFREKLNKKEDNVLLVSSECPHSVHTMSDKSKSIEIDIELEKEIEKESEVVYQDNYHSHSPIDYKKILDMFNQICSSYQSFEYQYLSVQQKFCIRTLMENHTYEDFETMFRKAEVSDFLKGQNPRHWTASLGWMIRDQNMDKILSGTYDNAEVEDGKDSQ